MKTPTWYDFTPVANWLQRVKLTAISLYKQRENIAYATEPIHCLTGLAANTSYVNAKATMQWEVPGRELGHHANSEHLKPDTSEEP